MGQPTPISHHADNPDVEQLIASFASYLRRAKEGTQVRLWVGRDAAGFEKARGWVEGQVVELVINGPGYDFTFSSSNMGRVYHVANYRPDKKSKGTIRS